MRYGWVIARYAARATGAVIAALVMHAIGFTVLHGLWYGPLMGLLGDPPAANPFYGTIKCVAVQTWSVGGPFLGGLVAGLILGWAGIAAAVVASGLNVYGMLRDPFWRANFQTAGLDLVGNEALALAVWSLPGAVAGAAVGATILARVKRKRAAAPRQSAEEQAQSYSD